MRPYTHRPDSMRPLFLIFVIVPILEMIILIKVGTLIGALPTVGLVVLTATLGIWLLRLQGFATLARVQEKLAQGQIPDAELLEGIMLLIGGALLLTPGFITDAMGFICLIPVFRKPLARWLLRRGILGAIHVVGGRGTDGSYRTQGSTTIEGEFSDEEKHL